VESKSAWAMGENSRRKKKAHPSPSMVKGTTHHSVVSKEGKESTPTAEEKVIHAVPRDSHQQRRDERETPDHRGRKSQRGGELANGKANSVKIWKKTATVDVHKKG